MAQSQPQVLTLNVERRAPGKRFPTAFHFFFEARRDPLAMLLWAAREYGDVARFDAWPLTAHLVFHPDHVKYVLQDNNRNYWKGDLIGRVKPLIGEGLFTSEGDFWRRQRRLAQPAFHRERIESFATIMSTAGARLLDGTVVELSAGVNWRWQPLLFQLGAIDNISPVVSAADFTLMARLTYRE